VKLAQGACECKAGCRSLASCAQSHVDDSGRSSDGMSIHPGKQAFNGVYTQKMGNSVGTTAVHANPPIA
jgi:hypothetical protein